MALIEFPNPATFEIITPVRQGTIHEYFYTGAVTDPVWFSGRHLWRVQLNWGNTTYEIGIKVELEATKLIEAGKGTIRLPIRWDDDSFESTLGSSTVNYSAKTIDFRGAIASKIVYNDNHLPVVQVGRYCLYATQKVGNVMTFVNLPKSGLSGTDVVAQGEGKFMIDINPTNVVPPRTRVISRKLVNIESISFVERP